VYKTVDGGSTWTNPMTSTTGAVNAVAFWDVNNGVVTCCDGQIHRTTDGGANWTQMTSPTNRTLNDLEYTNASTILACGMDGVIMKSSDGGLTWATQLSGTLQSLYNLCHRSLNTLYVCGLAGTLMKTTSGGEPTGWVDPEDLPLQIMLSPVRAGDPLQVVFRTDRPLEFALQVFDMRGRSMGQGSHSLSQAGESVVELPTTGWAPGLYLLSVQAGGRPLVCKVLLR